MKFIIFFGLIVAINAATFENLLGSEWSTFKVEHNKQYSNADEESMRFKIYLENRYMIAKHNVRYFKGQVSYEMGLNKFTDMLHSEFVSTMNGFKAPSGHENSVHKVGCKLALTWSSNSSDLVAPRSVDWREKGAVTPVKDQGHCGSCWAFSTTGALEGQYHRAKGVLPSLSEQNLVDCSKENGGCDGGWTDAAFEYIRKNKGIDTEKSYPYEANNGKCRFNKRNVGATESGCFFTKRGDENALRNAIANLGPMSIAIDASHRSFQFYSKGVYFEPNCGNRTEDLDHAVLVVGFGVEDNGDEYWLVKNSWGTTWGERGYIKMRRNRKNSCGVATYAIYPTV